MADYRGFGSAPQLVAAITKDVDEIPTVSSTTVTFDVPGALPGMFFVVAAPSLEAGLAIAGGAFSDDADVVKVKFVNPTAGGINPASQVYYFLGL